MLFQNPDNQIVASVVEEDVAFGPENLGVPSPEIRIRVDNALAAVNMTAYKDAQPHNLSGGQKQRVAIAGVLAMKPSCIVLDEPTAMLDPKGRKEVIQTVKKLNKERGVTVVLITHFMEEAAIADRVIVMSDGKVELDDAPSLVFRQVELLEKLGLGVPQVTSLAYRLGINPPPINIEEFMQHHAQTVTALPPPETMPPRKPIIRIQNLTHTYSPNTTYEKTAVKQISMDINQGEISAIIGQTGSGKSTLIQHLNGLMTATTGKVFFRDSDIADIPDLRQQVGLVFQYPEHQLFETTVYKDIAFGPTRMGLDTEEIDSRVRTALAAVKLSEDIFDKSPFELSGGQKRRVAIAGVLAMRPQVLILDEPAAGLDPRGKNEILGQIKEMRQTLDITVILVSHSMEDVAELATNVFVLNEGELVCQGAPQDIFSKAEMLQEIGLDIPQVTRLFGRLHSINPDIPANIYTVETAFQVLGGASQ